MTERYPDDAAQGGMVRKRLEYELGVIRKMGYVDYFLIVWDYINYAREHGIGVGPGRGSAAGSVVSYCLHITNLDPMKYDLIFERFLNPERVSMPDIDVDFAYERRGEVIDYVTRKYGSDRVVQIITFGTLQAKGVIRDVGRVMDLPYSFVDSIARMIPNELGMTLDKALGMNPDLRKAYEGDERVKQVIDMSRRLEGLPRHTSVHAAGVVICSKPAEDLVPLSRAADGSTTTQFTMTTIERLGLLKMDFLGLRTLTVIQNAVISADKAIDRARQLAAEDTNKGVDPAGDRRIRPTVLRFLRKRNVAGRTAVRCRQGGDFLKGTDKLFFGNHLSVQEHSLPDVHKVRRYEKAHVKTRCPENLREIIAYASLSVCPRYMDDLRSALPQDIIRSPERVKVPPRFRERMIFRKPRNFRYRINNLFVCQSLSS